MNKAELLEAVLAKKEGIVLTREEWNAIPENNFDNFTKRNQVNRETYKGKKLLVARLEGEADRKYAFVTVTRRAPRINRNLRTFELTSKTYAGLDWTGDYAEYTHKTLGTCEATSTQGAWATFRKMFGPLKKSTFTEYSLNDKGYMSSVALTS